MKKLPKDLEKWPSTIPERLQWLYWTIFPHSIRTAINPMTYFREAKYFIQRGRRGWSDRDWWGAYWYLSEILPPMLRKYASDDSHGHPGSFHKEGKSFEETEKEWHELLLKTADDIEAHIKFDERPFPKDKEGQDQYFADKEIAYKRGTDGMKVVSEIFFDLWD